MRGERIAGGLAQTLMTDPAAAARLLESDLAGGSNAETIAGLLDAAERLGAVRGVDLRLAAGAVRAHLRRSGYAL